ncbi:MAG: hypothetical protein M1817_000429 [Caeruleum heppii]|nr:MAG: hypothetical protein M1817_000429 [Caeruleum heppii]
MEPRSRPSVARTPGRTGRPSNPASTTLPSYQHLIHPLTPTAQQTLNTLPQDSSFRKIQEHIQRANDSLTDATGEITDRLVRKEDYLQRRRLRRERDGLEEDDGDEEDTVSALRQKVEDLTGEMEEGIRILVDAEVEREDTNALITRVGAAQGPPRGVNGPSQRPSRQRRGQRLEGSEEEEDEASDEYVDEQERSEPNGQAKRGPAVMLQNGLRENRSVYESQSMGVRYATNNNYIGFKRMVHDAQHPGDDAPPVPHAETWFPHSNDPPSTAQAQAQAPPLTRNRRNRIQDAIDDDSGDDDLAIASEKVSLNCPLTLRPFKKPVTSKKCPHSFEEEAILEMIEKSNVRIGGTAKRGSGERAVQCPVCVQMLSASDLYVDNVLIRRIRRLQQAATSTSDHSEDDAAPKGSQRAPVEDIEDADGGDQPRHGFTRLSSRARSVKRERASQARVLDSQTTPRTSARGATRDEIEDDEDE